jgi:hypothetical protein
MALTNADLDTIEAAIATSELRVRFSDGREVTYRSIDDLFKARDFIKGVLTGASSPRVSCNLATFVKD